MERLFSRVRVLVVLSIVLALGGITVVGIAAAPSSAPSSNAVAFLQGDDDDDDDTDTDDDDDDQSGGTATTDEGRPAHIHLGTCEELDPNPAYPLNGVVPDDDTDDDEVEVSATEVQVSLDELLAEPHAINIHASAENAETYVACGNITGQAVDLDGDDDDDAQLIVGLGEQNDSGLVGVATIDDDDDDGETDVHVYLTTVGDGASSAATPDAAG